MPTHCVQVKGEGEVQKAELGTPLILVHLRHGRNLFKLNQLISLVIACLTELTREMIERLYQPPHSK